MSPRPSAKHSIERIDNDGDYSPENCRWATQAEQLRNRRNTIRVMIDGTQYLAIDLATKFGLKADTIVERASQGLSFAEVTSKDRRHDLSGLKLGGKASGAKKLARTHCRKGHEYTPENTHIRSDGARQCRACHNAKMRRLNVSKRRG